MQNAIQQREAKLREVFGLRADTNLWSEGVTVPEIDSSIAAHLARFNLEWFPIPSAETVPFDEAYVSRFYPSRARDFTQSHMHGPSCQSALAQGHKLHQGRIIAVETTAKPRYLPDNRQYYGTPYGFDATADPLTDYMARAGFASGTRYAHTYKSLQELSTLVNGDWRSRGLMPPGYRLSLCPPAVFNLIGTVFHPEWSATETLELGFYRDAHGNATCYAVGCNAPGDFSYLRAIDVASDWTLLGFRTALVPV